MDGIGYAVCPLASGYDWHLVALSILIASVAAYVALALTERVAASRGRARVWWLLGGATAMGGGVWSMHFTGMLAFHLPVPIDYDVPLVVLSFIAAVAASTVTLFVASAPVLRVKHWLAGGVVMGIGVATMHYVGMAAMRMPARAEWDVRVVALSVGVAIVVSLVGLRIFFSLQPVRGRFAWRRVGAAIAVGFAIAGMHYTGMAAARFVAAPPPLDADVVGFATVGSGAIAFFAFSLLAVAFITTRIDRRLTEQRSALAESRRQLRLLVGNAPVILIALERDGTVKMAEGRDLGALGHAAQEMLGRSFFALYADEPALLEQARRAMDGEEHTAQTKVRGVVLETRWMPLRDASGAVEGVIAVASDVTERHRAETALKHQALHDALTDLPNRTFLDERLNRELALASARGGTLALAVVDLDRFKEVNDTLGHHAGDTLLKEIAERFRSVLRESDFVARLGGDEFAVVLRDANEATVMPIVERLLAELAQPCVLAERSIDVEASLGLAFYPEHGNDAETLLRRADVAMYAAKRGRRGALTYESSQDRHGAARLTLFADLRRAVDAGALLLHYQPKLDIRTASVHSVEALVRWPHPELGVLPPDQFIPLAEQTGVIVPLTRWVLSEAIRQLAAWDRQGLRLGMAVNLSLNALREPQLPEIVADLLFEHAIEPQRLTLEVTESAVMSDDGRMQRPLERLAELGVALAIDDLGTGYSSLSNLKRLPVAEIKIDKSFVISMAADAKDGEIVRLISDLGHALGLRVVAEGVETSDALEQLTALGCDVAQGYYLSRPLSADGFERWLRSAPWPSLRPVDATTA
ncbi:MAG TPA: EAL domain-containing protein [Candidatus Baltobacteraceae bacterium]|nr:EAL domain-containing protein [Candidatus Baltobacteraceae bacterium]